MQSPKNDFHAPTDNIIINMILISIMHFLFLFLQCMTNSHIYNFIITVVELGELNEKEWN